MFALWFLWTLTKPCPWEMEFFTVFRIVYVSFKEYFKSMSTLCRQVSLWTKYWGLKKNHLVAILVNKLVISRVGLRDSACQFLFVENCCGCNLWRCLRTLVKFKNWFRVDLEISGPTGRLTGVWFLDVRSQPNNFFSRSHNYWHQKKAELTLTKTRSQYFDPKCHRLLTRHLLMWPKNQQSHEINEKTASWRIDKKNHLRN